MRISFFLFNLILINKISLAAHCDISNYLASDGLETSLSLSNEISNLANISTCESFSKNDTDAELKTKLALIVASQTNDIYKIKDRHKMGNALNTCEPTKTSKALVISFAGTGAYNPRTHSLLAKLIKCENFQKLSETQRKKAYSILYNELKNKKSAYTKWSGIDKGIMSSFISDPELNKQAKHFDFATFASEESEMIADPEKIDMNSISNIFEEIAASTAGHPQGIVNARKCVIKYAMKSKELGIHPKLIVLSHSSGGRSAVKFLYSLKQNQIEADLVLTVDPVKEAQHALQEVASQYGGRIRDAFNPFVDNDTPVRVWSRKQPRSLYKTNSKKWVSFYQTEDTKGIGTSPGFSIYGSPVSGAENIKIKGVGAPGHGKICYTEEVIKKMKEEILEVVE